MEINALTYNPSQFNEKLEQKRVSIVGQSLESSIDQKKVKVSSEAFTEEVTKANEILKTSGHGIAFSIDESTKTSVIQLIDRDTNEVIKQYPNEDVLQMLDSIQKYLNLVNEGSLSAKESLTGSLINETI